MKKNQEKIAYKKGQLLLTRAQIRQMKAKIKNNHCYIVKQIKIKHLQKRSTKIDHTYTGKKAPSI